MRCVADCCMCPLRLNRIVELRKPWLCTAHIQFAAGVSEQTVRPAHRCMYVWEMCNYPAFTAATLCTDVVVARAWNWSWNFYFTVVVAVETLAGWEQAQIDTRFSLGDLICSCSGYALTIWMKCTCCLRVRTLQVKFRFVKFLLMEPSTYINAAKN